MLYPPDVKLLTFLKRVQSVPVYYVAIDYENMTAYQITGYFSADVMNAFNSGAGYKIPLSKPDLSVSIDYLTQSGHLLHPCSGPVYQVTHQGWFHKYVRRRELCRLLLTHVLFPSLVALVTTLLTLLFAQPEIQAHTDAASAYSTEQADAEPDDGFSSP